MKNGARGGAGRGCTAASVAGASNYSAINNPRVTRVIGPLSRWLRSHRRLSSFLPASHPLKVSMAAARRSDCPSVSRAFIASRDVHESIAPGASFNEMWPDRVPIPATGHPSN